MPTLKDAPLPEEKASAVFRTYGSYMSAWGLVLTSEYGIGMKQLLTAIQSSPKYAQLHLTGADLTEVRRHLRAAWNNEASMTTFLATADGDAVRYANVWAPVQSYYAVFAAARAFLVASKNHVPSHVGVLRSISSHLTSSGWVGAPWTAACLGCPSEGTQSWRDIPSSANWGVSNLTIPNDNSTAWGLIALSLKKAREKALEDVFVKWKDDNHKKRMPKAEKLAVAQKQHPTTVFDFIYRMRIRSNYRDTDDFVLGAWLDSDARHFYEAATYLLSSTLRFLEILVAGRIGQSKFDAILDEFLSASAKRVAN